MNTINDYISLRSFLPHTQQGIKVLCEHYDLWDAEQLANPEDWAALFFIMRAAPENEDFFPAGKWATIQDLERKLTIYATHIVKYVDVKKKTATA